ncbi:MAG TPA: NPCBM/NEW2 domain-containing protein [Pirellulales bacterium]|nr:NPCBM/NEW2 domain-containing protein [Pirellulales bacterium]
MRARLQILRSALAAAAVLLVVRLAAAEDVRYTAVFVDGNRVTGAHLTDWGNPNNQPRLNNRPLFDPSNAIRWLKKETPEQPSQPTAYVESFGGDCLPGRVIATGGTTTLEEGELPAHLIVEPTIPLASPEGQQSSRVRVLTRWLRRIVWERRTADVYQPATLFYRDGRQLPFRSIRFNPQGVSVLTDTERRDVKFTDIAELHMPRLDWWEAYFEQVALLTPDCKSRLTRIETLDGLKVTTSADRFQPMPSGGDANNPDYWYHAVQPAWSLDPLWVRHHRVLTRRYFGPHEVPLSLVEPSDTKLRSALAAGWHPQMDRNAQGGPLENSGQEAGWGIGMHAYTEQHFPLPACVQSFHSRVGLDHVVGKGGCARAIIYADKADGEPLFRSKHLIGSSEAVDTGTLPLTGSAGHELILVAHPAHADRPEGADPFDIRDVVDWLEPQVNLDLNVLRVEVRKRLERLLPGWQEWNVEGADRDKMIWVNRWDGANSRDRRFHLECRPHEASLTLTRTLNLESDQNWLLLYASRNPDGGQTSPTQMIVRIDGKQLGDFDVPARWGPTTPMTVPVDKYHGKPAKLEVRFVSRGDKSYVDWRSMAIVDKLPTLSEVFEDSPPLPVQLKQSDGQKLTDAKDSVVTFDRYSGTSSIKVPAGEKQILLTNLNLPIRENPRFGEYRYLIFAWKKHGGQQIALNADYSPANDAGPPAADRSRLLRQIARLKDSLAMGRRQLEALQNAKKERTLSRRETRQLEMLEERVQSGPAQIQQLELDLFGGANAAAGATAMHSRYFTGAPAVTPNDTRTTKMADHAPEQWSIVQRDLFQDFGGGQLNSITLSCPDGDYALFDRIYLARSPDDFNRCPPQAPPK